MDSMPRDQLSPSDHDTLIKIEAKFDLFVKQYIIDVKDLKDGTTKTLTDHTLRIERLEKTVDEFKPVETLKKVDELNLWRHDFKLTWKLMVTAATIIGSVVSFVFVTITNLLRH